MATFVASLPGTGFVRLRQIVGDKKAKPPIPAIIPVSRSSWWSGVQAGRYPKPVKLGPGITAWAVKDIHKLIRDLSSGKNSTKGGTPK
jgi:predicted DNA-binding transcriptional regulator AlpA